MDARELRIGNWVQLFRKPADKSMTCHSIKSIIYSDDDKGFMLELEDGFLVNANTGVTPIPLTEEIIKSCVGIIDNGLNGCEFDLGAGSALWFLDPQWYITNPNAVNSSMATDVKVPYVHSLQNLYFALTNTELKLKWFGKI